MSLKKIIWTKYSLKNNYSNVRNEDDIGRS